MILDSQGAVHSVGVSTKNFTFEGCFLDVLGTTSAGFYTMNVECPDGYQCPSDPSLQNLHAPDCKDQLVRGRIISSQPQDACSKLENVVEMKGAIAFVQRGTCSFSNKVLNAEQAGAAAVIVANSEVFTALS